MLAPGVYTFSGSKVIREWQLQKRQRRFWLGWEVGREGLGQFLAGVAVSLLVSFTERPQRAGKGEYPGSLLDMLRLQGLSDTLQDSSWQVDVQAGAQRKAWFETQI